MTRPRIAGAVRNCSAELTPAANITLAPPSGISIATATGSVGVEAAKSAKSPKERAEPTMRRSLTAPRAPVARAPATEPTAIATASAV